MVVVVGGVCVCVRKKGELALSKKPFSSNHKVSNEDV